MYGERRITRLDIYFASSLAVVLLALAINIFAQSIHLIYIVIILALGLLGYVTRKYEDERKSLRDLWILGLLSLALYPLIDYVFQARLGWVIYFTTDPKIVVTPPYIFLYWILGVLLFGYCYYRVHGLTNRVVVAGLIAGFLAAASTTFVENLFNAMGFYRNSPSYCMLWHIPIYIPLGYMLVFSLLPIYLRHKYIFGPLLYGLTGLGWYLFYHVVSRLALQIQP